MEAHDGMHALEILREAPPPDLVILDVNLPKMDGFTVVGHMRRLGLRTPVIMLTADTRLRARVHGLDCGADDFVGKPFDIPELIARVRAHLRRMEQARTDAQEFIRRKWVEINEGLMLAQGIQQPFRMKRQLDGLRTAVQYLPVGRVGGDFYSITELKDGRVALLIGDAVGKGLGASLLMASTFSLLTRILEKEARPSRVFAEANTVLGEDFSQSGLFVAAFLGVWDPATMTLTYSSAGHHSPILFHQGRRRHRFLSTNGFFLGAFEDGAYAEKTLCLETGDRLWLYTDGLSDLRSPAGELIDVRRIYRRMLRAWHLPVQEVIDHLLASFPTLTEGGVTLRDDLTAMLVEFVPRTAGNVADLR